MKQINICYVTTSRSEYGLVEHLLKEIQKYKNIKLSLIVSGSHLSKLHGNTFKEVNKKIFKKIYKIKYFSSDLEKDILLEFANFSKKLTSVLSKSRPDILMVMGDRIELLPILTNALILKIPIAHISGGQLSTGSVDNNVRYMATAASSIHFVANSIFKNRLLTIGESNWRVCISGEPGLESIKKLSESKSNLFKFLKINFKSNLKYALFCFHPEIIINEKKFKNDIDLLFLTLSKAIKKYNLYILFTYPNNDPGHLYIIKKINKFYTQNKKHSSIIPSLGRIFFVSCLKYFDLVIGNSSSIFYESSIFKIPCINIGDRQANRLGSRNVFHVGYHQNKILLQIKKSLYFDRNKKIKNYYIKKNSAKIIINKIMYILKKYEKNKILKKNLVFNL